MNNFNEAFAEVQKIEMLLCFTFQYTSQCYSQNDEKWLWIFETADFHTTLSETCSMLSDLLSIPAGGLAESTLEFSNETQL